MPLAIMDYLKFKLFFLVHLTKLPQTKLIKLLYPLYYYYKYNELDLRNYHQRTSFSNSHPFIIPIPWQVNSNLTKLKTNNYTKVKNIIEPLSNSNFNKENYDFSLELGNKTSSQSNSISIPSSSKESTLNTSQYSTEDDLDDPEEVDQK